MSVSLKKLWNEYGIGGVILALIVLYALFMLYNYLITKGQYGNEGMGSTPNPVYGRGKSTEHDSGPRAAQEMGNEVYSSVNSPSSSQGSCTNMQTQNSSDLLPKDTNSQWAQLNPAGKGDLANINLLKAGYHIGIDTVGQTLRNANLQIRSEPPNPQLNTGPWLQSTITPDLMRPSLELGQGGQ